MRLKPLFINILAAVIYVFFSGNLTAQSKYIFTIRIDDIQSRGNQTPRTILAFSEMIAKHKAKLSWCVIPHRLIESQNLDGGLVRDIRESIVKYGFEVFQHGYNHICSNCGSSGHEMVCLTNKYNFIYNEQKNIILDGIKILKDSLKITPTGFVAPAHVQDSTTFSVLSDLGFKYISYTAPEAKFGKKLFNLNSIPINQEFTWSLTDQNYSQQFNAALKDIESNIRRDKYYGILLHDPFIRGGYSNGITIKFIDELLTKIESIYKDTLRYMTLTEASEEFEKKTEITLSKSINKSDNLEIYPNPFNSNTNISWDQTFPGQTLLTIYDAKSSAIQSVNLGYLSSNSYNHNFNAGNLSSGIYFVQIKSEKFIKFNKLLLMK